MKIINSLKNKNINDLKNYIIDNKDQLKTVALPLIIGAAVLFFWIYGSDNGEITIEQQSALPAAEQAVEAPPTDEPSKSVMYVDISGAVKSPGVYPVSEGTRLFEVIEMAGGLQKNADIDEINRAEPVCDGQKIIVGEKTANDGVGAKGVNQQDNNKGIMGGKVNINYADSATLQTIPGIGPTRAESIIEYRQSQGKFIVIEDIKNITGIGDKTFERIKEYITV